MWHFYRMLVCLNVVFTFADIFWSKLNENHKGIKQQIYLPEVMGAGYINIKNYISNVPIIVTTRSCSKRTKLTVFINWSALTIFIAHLFLPFAPSLNSSIQVRFQILLFINTGFYEILNRCSCCYLWPWRHRYWECIIYFTWTFSFYYSVPWVYTVRYLLY